MPDIEYLRRSVVGSLFPSGAETTLDMFFGENGVYSGLPIFDQDAEQCLLIAGATGIVGFEKTLQFAYRLYWYGVRIIAVDLPSTSFDWVKARKTLSERLNAPTVNAILESITFLQTDQNGRLTPKIRECDVKMVFEAIPEKVKLKQGFFKDARSAWPKAILLSATSGLQAQVLFEGIDNAHLCTIAHPSFRHLINLWFEIVKPGDGAPIDQETYDKLVRLFLYLGLIPKAVKDVPSFVLDRIFCSLINQCLRFMEETHCTPQQVDALCQKLFGPRVRPFFAHDMIARVGGRSGAANALTFSCLDDLNQYYQGGLFTPHRYLSQAILQVSEGHNFIWFSPDTKAGLAFTDGDQKLFQEYVLGGLAIVISQILDEDVADIETINGISEGCSLFSKGIMVLLQEQGQENVLALAQQAIKHCGINPDFFHAEVFEEMEKWMFYVNVEISTHSDGQLIGHITMSRSSYCMRMDKELNLALDWLKEKGVKRIIISGDFATSSQFGVGADTTEFEQLKGFDDARDLALQWTKTARRLRSFEHSMALITKKAWGGMLELALHCHTVIAVDGTSLRFPEVTIKVVHGMEAYHLSFRRASEDGHELIYLMLMNGGAVDAAVAQEAGLIDYVGPRVNVITMINTALTAGPPEFREKGFKLDNAIFNIELPPCFTHERGYIQPYSDECRRTIETGIKRCCALAWDGADVDFVQAETSAKAMIAPWGFLGGKK